LNFKLLASPRLAAKRVCESEAGGFDFLLFNFKFNIMITFLKEIFITKIFAADNTFTLGAQIPGCSAKPSPSEYINCIYKLATWLAIGLAILMIVWGGYKYITSQGNPDSIEEAKTIVTGAIIGLVLVIIARLILTVISPNLVG
jgi:hypothetical protein